MTRVNGLGASPQVYHESNTYKTAVDKHEKPGFFTKIAQAITSCFGIQAKKHEKEAALKERVTSEPKTSVLPPQIIQKIAAPAEHISDVKNKEPLSLDDKKREISLQVETSVRKGLKELENIFDGVPTFDSLKLLMDKYIHAKLTNNLRNSLEADDDSTKLVIKNGKGYFILPDSIYQSSTKKIHVGIDLETGEYPYFTISKGNKNDAKYTPISDEIFNILKELANSNKGGGILPLYAKLDMDFIEENEALAQMIIEKFCLDGDLFDFLQDNADLSLNSKRTIALDVINGLLALHSKDLFHGDLKTENVFISEGHAFIGDFETTAFKNSSKRIIGSPQFLSPEKLLTKTEYNEKTEVWMLGHILYEIFSGERSQIIEKIDDIGRTELKTPYDFHKMLPWDDIKKHTQLSLLLSKMLNVDPEKRYTLKEVAEQFEAIPTDELIFNLPEKLTNI